MYLMIELNNEEYPMPIKLSNQPVRTTTSMFYPQLDCQIADGKVYLDFLTNYIKPVDTIDGVRVACASKDLYGHHHVKLIIECERLSSYSIEMLDDDSTFIRACRQYFTDKYGVSYES
jgi:hypothetical protein